MNPTAETPVTALILWNEATEAQVRAFIASGASVPKGLMKVAPKAFVAELRATRKAELQKNTASLLGGFTDKGFKIVSATPIETQKSGVQIVTLKLATPKPTAKMTLEEYATQNDMTVADVIASLDMAEAPKAPAKKA